jgi:hypothetical protein
MSSFDKSQPRKKANRKTKATAKKTTMMMTTATISAILKNPRDGGFVSGSLVYRYPPQPRIDGLPGEEGTFNMCSFWLVEALTRSILALPEKLDQARLLLNGCWAMPIISGFTRNKTDSRAKRWVISRRLLHIGEQSYLERRLREVQSLQSQSNPYRQRPAIWISRVVRIYRVATKGRHRSKGKTV